MDMVLQKVFRGLVMYRAIIYILLGVGILVYLRMLIIGVMEWKKSVFGLERRIAQRRLVSASTGLILLSFLLVGEFLLVTLIEPRMPAQSSESQVSVDPLVVPTTTLQLDENPNSRTLPVVEGSDASVEQGELVFECVEDQVEITEPTDGGTISGTVEIFGSVYVDNFGSYKYEFSPVGNINWITIAAGNQLKLHESIGFWYTSELTPGRYLLRLVPLDNTGKELMPCIITVEVVAPKE